MYEREGKNLLKMYVKRKTLLLLGNNMSTMILLKAFPFKLEN